MASPKARPVQPYRLTFRTFGRTPRDVVAWFVGTHVPKDGEVRTEEFIGAPMEPLLKVCRDHAIDPAQALAEGFNALSKRRAAEGSESDVQNIVRRAGMTESQARITLLKLKEAAAVSGTPVAEFVNRVYPPLPGEVPRKARLEEDPSKYPRLRPEPKKRRKTEDD